MSKTTQLQQLLAVSKNDELHRESRQLFSSDSPPFSTSSFSFRTNAATSLESDFTQFASTSSSSSSLAPFSSNPTTWSLFPDGQRRQNSSSAFPAPAPTGDGQDVLALLSPSAPTSLTDAVDGDWEAELFANRAAQAWKHEQERAMPADPRPSSATTTIVPRDYMDGKGKGKGKARAGDVSPVTAELISSLSSLDVASRNYLESFLAMPPEESVARYLEQGSYSDDVHGMPPLLRKMWEKAQAGDEEPDSGEGAPFEEGKQKAVRRLQMVMRHFLSSKSSTSAITPVSPTFSTTTPSPAYSARSSLPSPSPFVGTPTLLESSSQRLLADTRTSFSSTSSPEGLDYRVVDSPRSATSSFGSTTAAGITRSFLAEDFRVQPLFASTTSGPSTITSSKTSFSNSLGGERLRGEPFGKTDGDLTPSTSYRHPLRKTEVPPSRQKNDSPEEEDTREVNLEPFQTFMERKLSSMSGLVVRKPGIL